MQALGGLEKDHESTSKVAQTHSPSKESLLEELQEKPISKLTDLASLALSEKIAIQEHLDSSLPEHDSFNFQWTMHGNAYISILTT